MYLKSWIDRVTSVRSLQPCSSNTASLTGLQKVSFFGIPYFVLRVVGTFRWIGMITKSGSEKAFSRAIFRCIKHTTTLDQF